MRKSAYVTRVPIDRASLWDGKGPSLRSLDVELTERCNNNCIHCYINKPRDAAVRKREISTENIKSVLREACDLGCLTVRFTGGEPLLREDFEDVYLFSRKIGLRVILFTNASLITPHLASLLARIPPLERVEASFYGMSKQSYEAVTRVQGSHAAAVLGMERLRKKGVPFIVKNALLPPNKAEVEDFEAWAASLPWTDNIPSYTTTLNLRARRDSEPRNKAIRALRLKPEEQYKVLTRNKNAFIKETRAFFSRFAGPQRDRLFFCGAGRDVASLDSYGTLQACLLLRHPDTVFPLKKGTLKEAMAEFFPKVRKTRASNPEYIRRCGRCFLMGFCNQCPARSWMEHGTLDTPVEDGCAASHYAARELELLKQGENAWEVRDWEKRIGRFSKGGGKHEGES